MTVDPQASPRIEVPRIVDDQQVAFYVENGFLTVPDLVSPDELDE